MLLNGDDTVHLPPVRQVDLVQAARVAGCRLERAGRTPLNPPVAGAVDVAPAAPGIYERPPDSERVVGALRRGYIAIHYRPGLDDDLVDALGEIQRTVPEGTLLVPNDTMSYEVAATAWRRLLGCPRFSRQAVDALRLFRGRFLGSGPLDPPVPARRTASVVSEHDASRPRSLHHATPHRVSMG